MDMAEAARRAQISLKRARHYQAIGVLQEHANNSYDEGDVHTLRFIRRARALGFSVGEIRALLNLWQDRDRPAQEVHRLAQRQEAQIKTRIAVLQAMLAALQRLTEGCAAGERPQCPILDEDGVE